jgi:hypothetical protein
MDRTTPHIPGSIAIVDLSKDKLDRILAADAHALWGESKPAHVTARQIRDHEAGRTLAKITADLAVLLAR